MKIYINLRSDFYKLGSFLIALSLILNCGSIWSTVGNFSIFLFSTLIIGIILCFFSIKPNDIYFSKQNIFFISFFSIYLLIYILQPQNILNLKYGIEYFISFFSLLFYVIIFERKENILLSIKYYINIMAIIGCISLLFWTFGSLFKVISPTGSIISYWSTENGTPCPSYYGIYFETQSLNNIIRNTAIFTEAPMASLNFVIAFLFQDLFNKGDRSHNIKEIILILCILSTISTTGYIALILIFVLKMLLMSYRNKNILLPVGVVVGIISIFLVHFLLSLKINDGSGQTRVDDFRAGLQAWKLHPFMGSGLDSSVYRQFMANWRSYNLGFSNTIMDVLSSGGIYIFILYFISVIVSLFKSLKDNNISNIIFIILISYLFITTIFSNTYILFLVFILISVNSSIYRKRIETLL